MFYVFTFYVGAYKLASNTDPTPLRNRQKIRVWKTGYYNKSAYKLPSVKLGKYIFLEKIRGHRNTAIILYRENAM